MPEIAIVVVSEPSTDYITELPIDRVFQLASMSKPIATTVIAAVVSQGSVGWDDRVAELDPKLKLADPDVTVGAATLMQAGIYLPQKPMPRRPIERTRCRRRSSGGSAAMESRRRRGRAEGLSLYYCIATRHSLQGPLE